MAPSQSNLSNPKYLYDFVVATSQESINSGLVQYLQNTGNKQPYTYLCFLADENGEPTEEVSLEEILKRSGGVNPFDIPDGTDWKDERVQRLYEARLICAIRMRTGIPPGCIVNVPNKGPQLKLPEPIVTLGKTSEAVHFNMYCSEVTIIKNNIPGGRFPTIDNKSNCTDSMILITGWGSKGSWVWFQQPSGSPWYVKTQTNLLNESLDKNLDTEYFKNHPEEREALRAKLANISGSAFSLQQLLFNLQSAVAQTAPTFAGVTDKAAESLLRKSFIDLWSGVAKDQGLPLVGVTAVAQYPDGSPLCLTALERWVSPVVDPNSGQVIQNPSDLQLSATTLNYLCATDGHPLPGASSFNWNWIEPSEVSQSSGVISIKRSTMAQHLVNKMEPLARKSCIKPSARVTADNVFGKVTYYWGFSSGQQPTVKVTPSGPLVATLDYSNTASGWDQNAATYGELKITSTYSCSIVFGKYDLTKVPPVYIAGNTFTVIQNFKVYVYVQWAATGRDAWVADKTLTDEYVVSVDDSGGLTSTPTKNSTVTDNSKPIDVGAIVNFFTGVKDLLQAIKDRSSGFLNAHISSIPFNQIKNFVFPGAHVFSYKSAAFSNYSDLACLITYVNPTKFQQQQKVIEASDEVESVPEAIALDELPPLAAFIKELRAEDLKRIAEEGLGHSSQFEEHPDVQGSFTVTEVHKHNDDGTSDIHKHLRTKGSTGKATITTSTELMLNYVQGELVKPEGKFRALQASNGTALLFAIDSSGVLNVIEETVAQTQTGWRATDMSSKVIKDRFPSGAMAMQFDVGQSVMNGYTISLAMSVRSNGSDTLFLSLRNSPSSTSEWISKPYWRSIPFDAENGPDTIHITNIYISETDQQQQYIMVDILRDPGSELKATSRYVVDPFSSSGVSWTARMLPFEVEEGTYQSCMGRVSGAYVDGIYTAGSVKGAPQLSYVPLFNLTGSAAPMPTRLPLPNRTLATAIASARYDGQNSPRYGTTDLYAVGNSTLYRWDPDQQLDDNTVGTPLLTNSVFAGTDTLIALMHNKITTIFGKNASNVVYYTSCHVDKLAEPQSWSAPVPVLRGVERITSFINLKDGGKTVFAAGGSKIQKLTQATNTDSKLWRNQSIMLEAAPETKAISFNSYTTTINVKGEDGLPVSGSDITLTTKTHTPVYIDGLYYILSEVPVNVTVNPSGEVIIIQATDSIVGATITARLGNKEHTINPMASSFEKLAKLSDKDVLKTAEIRTNVKAGGVIGESKTESLVSSGLPDEELKATADSIKLLTEAYNKHQAQESALRMMTPVTSNMVVSQGGTTFGLGDAIIVAAGDLFNWLKTGIEKVIQVVQNAATGLWEFIVKIGNEVYRAILDTVEAVVGAIEWVFDKIKTGVEKLIRFIEFLFQWDDIKRTKQVTHNLVKYYLFDMVSSIETAKDSFDSCMDGAQKAVAEWAGIKDWAALGDAATNPPSGNATDPTKHQNSGSQMMAGHFRNQADRITIRSGMPEASMVQGLVDDMIKAMESQGMVFTQTYDQLKTLAEDFLDLSLADTLKRLTGILVQAVLGTTKVVVDAMLDVLYRLAGTVVDVLDTKIHIPVISDILNAIGVPDISFLDLFTWIGAAGITTMFKLARGQAPFPDNATTRALIDAQDWESFSAVLKQGVSATEAESSSEKNDLEISQEVGQMIYSAGHALAGFVAFTGNFLFFAEAMDVSPTNVFGMPSAIMGVIGALAAGGADFLVAKMPIENSAVSTMRTITTVTTVVSKIIFSGPGQKYLAKGYLSFMKANDNRKVGAVFNTALVFPALFCTCYHFYELSKKPVSKERSLAIIGETSSMVQYVGRVSYCVAIFDPEPSTRLIPASVMAGCNVVMFGLETAGALIF
ncbi:uncharacterized protein FTJAE_769 [Fusarium tjaetaba]|uniref:Uncharacterized protein n=1 Tax=Fusarium tjaetaba TaxID=1567544 RepID=A0A8H5W918_9HYPO|nr:uncharacterized protein FTJAE_769 [Fusarium tjaetaba]KAF5649805.1 hypothetical protein FTJAE_769 [Fusarium tjaetaba]